ncbi:hypothetical protein M413DRAFT_446501 [Hebeloma cylindrosporum]|uniref:Major facilitator superfamily (MFS) profile domain-containing protein n=1 Tax=Hebeloma cylindrosporum TaxID=76867 RepID=A0A0C2YGU8_HEBCY|nr:hypothetical protein M413DRAFT_446501 [Hebeloma cylindrosporum h7]
MADRSSYSDEKEKESTSDVKTETGGNEHDIAFERKTMRYVDWRIIPVLSMVYSFSLIDRINLGAAYTAGMGVDLNLLTGNRYSIVSALYFVPYVLLQLPGVLILRYVGVRNWMTFIVLAWGIVQLCMGFINSWGYMILCRVLLGIFESSFFPALLFIIATWYKRHEVHKRLSVFYLISVTAGGLSPILAYVFSLLRGKQGLAGWRWIFIIEGAITIFLGGVTWFFIPAFPDQNDFLTPEQTALVLKRIDDDRGDALPDPVTFEKVKTYLADWTLWAYGLMFMCTAMPTFSMSFFLPIILKGMGWSRTAALLLSAPPYGPSIITTMIVAYYSDKTKNRYAFIIGPALVTLIGLCLTAFARQNEVRYFGVFLINAGNSAVTPTVIAYSSNNVVSHSKKSVQTALMVMMGSTGATIATVIFRAKDTPTYKPGLSTVLGMQIVLVLTASFTTWRFSLRNKAMREGKRTEPLEGQPGFYYTL